MTPIVIASRERTAVAPRPSAGARRPCRRRRRRAVRARADRTAAGWQAATRASRPSPTRARSSPSHLPLRYRRRCAHIPAARWRPSAPATRSSRSRSAASASPTAQRTSPRARPTSAPARRPVEAGAARRARTSPTTGSASATADATSTCWWPSARRRGSEVHAGAWPRPVDGRDVEAWRHARMAVERLAPYSVRTERRRRRSSSWFSQWRAHDLSSASAGCSSLPMAVSP